MSPVGVSLTEPVTLNGPPNSFCSALSVRSHLSSMLEMSAPTDTLVSVGRMLKRSAWLVAQLCTCPVAFGSVRVSETPFCSVNETSSPTGTERLNVERHHRAGWRQELSGTIAQCLKLEHEIHDTASKLCILGFEPLK